MRFRLYACSKVLVIISLALAPLVSKGQTDSVARPVQAWVEIQMGHRMPVGYFGLGINIDIGRYLNPCFMMGLGGGPDGFTLAIGNSVGIASFWRMDLRAFAYGAYAVGRREEDGVANIDSRTTASSGSLKIGGALRFLVSKDLIISIFTGYSWVLQVPMVVDVGPNGTSTYRDHSGYYTNAPIIGLGISAR